MNTHQFKGISKGESSLVFLLLGIVIYLPFAIYANVQVFPNWSLVNFGFFIPALVALILVSRADGTASMVEFLKRPFDYKRIQSKIWYLPIFLLVPFTVLIQYGLTLIFGSPVSSPYFPISWPPLFVILFIEAIGEELGWMGYLFEPMQERFGALKASILLGIVQALFHIPLFTAGNMSSYWIIWQLIYVVATRVLFVWVYNNTGKSLFAMVMLHTLFNSVWFLFPRNPDLPGVARPVFYNPTSLALITIALATIVTFLWGPKTLAQYRYARASDSRGQIQDPGAVV